METFVGGVSEPLSLFPDHLRAVEKHSVPRSKARPMKAYRPIEDWDKQVLILLIITINCPGFLSEFQLRERASRTFLK